MYRGSELPFFDFSGGMASNRPSTLLENNQAILLRNIIITPGKGFKKRQGNTAFNASAMTGSGAITGLQYFKPSSGNDHLAAITGSKIFESASLDGTMNDITGAVSITSGANNIWTSAVFNDLAIFVGGAPDAPIKYSGTGNAAVLGGTPPNGNFCFTVNGRFFIGNTTANPSRLAWSILSNPEDWSGTGSGIADVQKNDGDSLVGAGIISDDLVLLFKETSIHKIITRSSPFPVFPLFKGIGAVGKNAIVAIDGIIYFISPRAKMFATDGNQILDFNDDIDDVWSGLNTSRLKYIQGIRYQGQGYDHLVWHCSSGSSSTNNLAIVWDLTNKCWLQHTSGYSANIATLHQNGVMYMGSYDGKIYKQDVSGTYADASEASPGAIDALWRSGWNTQKSLQQSIHPFKLNIALLSQTTGNLRVGYGFDFSTDQISQDVDMKAPGGLWDQAQWDIDLWGYQSDIVRSIFTIGRGNAFQISIGNLVASQAFIVHGFTVAGNKSAQKLFQVA